MKKQINKYLNLKNFIEELDLNKSLVHTLYTKYSKAKRINKKYIYGDNKRFVNFYKGIANVGISIRNQWNEKHKIEKNFNDYFSDIKILIENIQEEYNSEIELIKIEILNKIDNDLRNNINKFEEIKNQREEYNKINIVYLKIIIPIKI